MKEDQSVNSPPAASAQTIAVVPVPVGTVLTFAGTGVPNGWLLCDGQSINATTYPQLYAVVGGAVPDLRSRFIVGAGQGGGLTNYNLRDAGGEESHQLSVNEIPAHTHTINKGNFGLHGRSFEGNNDSDLPFENSGYTYPINGTDATGGGQAHENRPPYYALTYIIKY